jgi:cell wall-associated NlpC family hydrolase
MKTSKLLNQIKYEKFVIIAGLVLLGYLILAGILMSDDKKTALHYHPTPEEIICYARTFLQYGENEKSGKRLDCSGYTKEVFGHFSIILPASSAKQYNMCERLHGENTKKGDLIFFRIKSSSISHVGICLDNINFIHSPGRNKYVRIDQLTDPYWNRYLAGYGRVPEYSRKKQ